MTPTPHTGLALRISLLALAHGGILQGLVDLSACPCISSSIFHGHPLTVSESLPLIYSSFTKCTYG